MSRPTIRLCLPAGLTSTLTRDDADVVEIVVSAVADGSPRPCPTCGGALADLPLPFLKAAVSPMMGRILDVVVRRPGIDGVDLAAAVYADDPDGGPDWARNSVGVTIWRNNKRLAPLGWCCKGHKGRGGGYSLVRLPEPVSPPASPATGQLRAVLRGRA